MTKILAIKSGGIGDVLLALPALEALKKRHHPCSLSFMGPPALLPFFDGEAATVNIESAAMASWMGPEPDAHYVQFFSEHDLIVSWFGYGSTEFRRNVERVAPGRAHFIPPRPSDSGVHVSEFYLKCLEDLGLADRGVEGDLWRPRIPPAGKRSLELTLVLHPGSGSSYKNWPPERYASLARWAIETLEAKVVLVSGPADAEAVRAVSEGLLGTTAAIVHSPPLYHLARIISGSSLFVGNDSGISHLAAATGTPTVAIYGPTDPRVWGVRGSRAFSIWKGLACSPCVREDAIRCSRRKCLEEISVEEVASHRVIEFTPLEARCKAALTG